MSPLPTSHLHDEPRIKWAPLAIFALSFALWAVFIFVAWKVGIWAVAFARSMGWL